jgi:glutathione synthase
MSHLKIGFIMDPIETLRTEEDSTYLFMLESQARGHENFYMTVPDLSMSDRTPMGACRPVQVFRDKEYYRIDDEISLSLNDFDVLFMRKDPPFDMEYYTATLILSMVDPKTLVINNPRGLRDNNEKAGTLRFPELVPKTLITKKISLLQKFLVDVGGEMIVKPLYRSYGRDILYVQKDNINCNTLLEIATREESQFIMAQQYLREAAQGDKRIILLNGEPIGAVLWLPPDGSGDLPPIRTPWRETRTELTERERTVCQTIAPYLKENGLFFAGVDMIGGYLTEINITSPTCLHEINRLNNDCLEAKVIDFVEEKCKKRSK